MNRHRLSPYLLPVLVFGLSVQPISFSRALFSQQITTFNHTVTTGCWDKPTIPEHIYPTDSTVVNEGSSWLDDPYLDWDNSTTTCPHSTDIWYQYQSYHDAGLSSLAYESNLLTTSMIPALNTPDGTYYWRVRSFDGFTYSDWSTPWLLTVDRSISVAASGNVVINEIMWMGSTDSTADEWIELRNMTDKEINLSNWSIDGAGAFIIPEGKTIPANGFFLISNYQTGASAIADSIIAGYVTTDVELINGGMQLTLKANDDTVIDRTPVGVWVEGANDDTKHSMERNAVPNDGTLAGSWHTCVTNSCNDGVFWDNDDGENYGTPNATNHSENDPTAKSIEPPVVKEEDSEESSGTETSTSGTSSDQKVPAVTPTPIPSVTPTQPLPTDESIPDPVPTLKPAPMSIPSVIPIPTPLVTPTPEVPEINEGLNENEDIDIEEEIKSKQPEDVTIPEQTPLP